MLNKMSGGPFFCVAIRATDHHQRGGGAERYCVLPSATPTIERSSGGIDKKLYVGYGSMTDTCWSPVGAWGVAKHTYSREANRYFISFDTAGTYQIASLMLILLVGIRDLRRQRYEWL
jgi:hypothetical protein